MKQTRPLILLLLTLLSAFGSGCFLWTTRGEGNELEERVSRHGRRMEELESGLSRERQKLRQEIDRAETQVVRLQGIIESATRTGADIGASVAELQQRIQQLEGQLAESRELAANADRQVTDMREELEQRLAAPGTGAGLRLTPDQVPANARDHFAAAQQALGRQGYDLARALFREYVNRYQTDERADEAQYFVGVSYLRQSNYSGALGEFRKVLTDYPRSDSIDDTLLDMAEAFFQLNACSDAKAALNTLIRSHRRSPLVRRARTKLNEIDAAPASHCAS